MSTSSLAEYENQLEDFTQRNAERRKQWKMAQDAAAAKLRQAYEHCRRAEQARHNIEKSIKHVEPFIGTADDAGIPWGVSKAFIDGAKQGLVSMKAAHEGILESLPTACRSRETSVLTEKLTSLPELVEETLLYLPNADLLNAMQVCHLFNGAVSSSARIARKMGLKEDSESPVVYCPTRNYWFAEFFCSPEIVETTASSSNEPRLRINVKTQDFQRLIGSRCRSIRICQPPLKEIHAFASCCTGSRYWRQRDGDNTPPTETITSETGITVGDLIDATDRLKKSHRLCPDATSYSQTEDGYVNVQVSFEDTVKCSPDDPLYAHMYQRMVNQKEKHRERVAGQRRIDAYAVAKRTARDQGQPIPTLVEFEAAQSGMASTS